MGPCNQWAAGVISPVIIGRVFQPPVQLQPKSKRASLGSGQAGRHSPIGIHCQYMSNKTIYVTDVPQRPYMTQMFTNHAWTMTLALETVCIVTLQVSVETILSVLLHQLLLLQVNRDCTIANSGHGLGQSSGLNSGTCLQHNSI